MRISRTKLDLILAKKQLSIKELCESANLPTETFKQARTGARNPTPKTIGRIAAALGVEVTEIIDMDGETK